MITLARIAATLVVLLAWGRGLVGQIQWPTDDSWWLIAMGTAAAVVLVLALWLPTRWRLYARPRGGVGVRRRGTLR